MLPKGDDRLVQILDAALADATQRSGNWLVCKPGCTPCCVGAFAINRLDAERLQLGLEKLTHSDPERAAALRKRAESSVERIKDEFPGDPITGTLDDSEEAEALFEDFANDEPCPALDPSTGMCDLYQARPMTCRVFGPPVRSEQGLGVCELCYHGATEEQIASCEMVVDPEGIEATLLEELEPSSAGRGRTLVAFALAAGTINS
jgi:Fe-S-cluster containining protein